VTPEQLSAAIRAALQSAVDAGDLAITVPAEVRVERPRNRDHGDWSTNIALQLAKGAGMPPRELATALADAPRVRDRGAGRRRRRPRLPQHHPRGRERR
jgi:arginyl-tRNA synthetase